MEKKYCSSKSRGHMHAYRSGAGKHLDKHSKRRAMQCRKFAQTMGGQGAQNYGMHVSKLWKSPTDGVYKMHYTQLNVEATSESIDTNWANGDGTLTDAAEPVLPCSLILSSAHAPYSTVRSSSRPPNRISMRCPLARLPMCASVNLSSSLRTRSLVMIRLLMLQCMSWGLIKKL